MLDSRLAKAEAGDSCADLVYLLGLCHRDLESLTADKIDAEIEAFGNDKRNRCDQHQQRDEHRQFARTQKVDVGVVWNQFQQRAHRRSPYNTSSRGRVRLTQMLTHIRVSVTAQK